MNFINHPVYFKKAWGFEKVLRLQLNSFTNSLRLLADLFSALRRKFFYVFQKTGKHML